MKKATKKLIIKKETISSFTSLSEKETLAIQGGLEGTTKNSLGRDCTYIYGGCDPQQF